MKQTLGMKIRYWFYRIMKKIVGKEYDCCDEWKKCSKCKYVVGESGE